MTIYEAGKVMSLLNLISNVDVRISELKTVSWDFCQEEQRKNKFKNCDNCHERFKCWTACYPNDNGIYLKDFVNISHILGTYLAGIIDGEGSVKKDGGWERYG